MPPCMTDGNASGYLMNLTDIAEKTLAVAHEAGEIIRSNWAKPSHVEHKGRIDLVTDTDLAVERLLKEKLPHVLPGATILAEESSAKAELGELTWVVDPLDGTTNFAHRLPFVAVSIGLWREGSMQLGVVANPIINETFHAVRGQGAFLNGGRIHVSDTADLERSLVTTGFPYAIEEHVEDILAWMQRALLASQGLRRYGSAALDLAYVAAGRYEAFYECCLNPWDTAAGWLLVEEAGGRVTPIDAGQEYHLRAPTILASNGAVHQAMSRMLLGT